MTREYTIRPLLHWLIGFLALLSVMLVAYAIIDRITHGYHRDWTVVLNVLSELFLLIVTADFVSLFIRKKGFLLFRDTHLTIKK